MFSLCKYSGLHIINHQLIKIIVGLVTLLVAKGKSLYLSKILDIFISTFLFIAWHKIVECEKLIILPLKAKILAGKFSELASSLECDFPLSLWKMHRKYGG